MDVKSTLKYYGRNIVDENILQRIDHFGLNYSLDKEDKQDIIYTFVSYLITKNIQDENITMHIIEDFENEKLKKVISKKSPIKLPAVKSKRILQEGIFNIISEYESEDKTFVQEKDTLMEVSTDVEENKQIISQKLSWPIITSDNETCKYMYQTNRRILEVNEENALNLFEKRFDCLNANEADETSKLNLSNISSVDTPNQEVYICGTIVIDNAHSSPAEALDHKLSIDNIAIRGLATIKPKTVTINLEETESYSFFPGQHVILKGHNSFKTGFAVNKILTNPIIPCAPIDISADLNDLRVLIACGPFTDKKSDDNSLIKSILEEVEKQYCDVLILIGPFADENNEAIQKRTERDLECDILKEKLTFIAKKCISMNVKVVIVPSVTDISHHENEFPQDHFEIFSENEKIQNHPLIHFVTNPALFNIGPFRFGVSSADILLHMLSQEINKKCNLSACTRLLTHVVEENNFYPLKPPHPSMSIDWPLWRMCDFGSSPPHCLILPSFLATFNQDIGGVYCVNPGYVVKNNIVEKFAVLKISASNLEEGARNISGAASCEFIRLK